GAPLRPRILASRVRASGGLSRGAFAADRAFGRLKPAAVIGFGGYPTIPPVAAAAFRRIPTLIHEQNGVMGKANRLLAPLVRAIPTSLPRVLDPHPKPAPQPPPPRPPPPPPTLHPPP